MNMCLLMPGLLSFINVFLHMLMTCF